MQRMRWTSLLIKQCEGYIGQALSSDSLTLENHNQDFGRLIAGQAFAVCKPRDLATLQKLFNFISEHKLPLTIRANGLSQSGQSLVQKGGLSLDIHALNEEVTWEGDSIKAGCSASWKSIIETALQKQRLPSVYPYNTQLTLGGVLSVGGIGAASFKKGIIGAYVNSMEVITVAGEKLTCSPHDNQDLFQACLAGAGQFGLIYSATLSLEPCKQKIQTVTLEYDDPTKWINDQFLLQSYTDYLESFVVIENSTRHFIIQFSTQYEKDPPAVGDYPLQATMIKGIEEKTLHEYIYRHDPRINGLQETGAWWQAHPWYECYVEKELLLPRLDDVLKQLDPCLGGLYHLFPIAPQKPDFFMLPEGKDMVTFNILSPQIPPNELQKAIRSLVTVDNILKKMGGKRYISGWFPETDWSHHYGNILSKRNKIKQRYDPHHLLSSCLFNREAD